MSDETRFPEAEMPRFDFDLTATLGTFMRLACLVTGIGVIGVGIYFGWRVYEHIESVVTEGKPLQAAVEQIAKVIEAEKIVIDQPEAGVKAEVGRSVAVGIVWMFYILWTWVSLGFIKAGGSLIISAVAESGSKRK